jgi:hypothetical protein
MAILRFSGCVARRPRKAITFAVIDSGPAQGESRRCARSRCSTSPTLSGHRMPAYGGYRGDTHGDTVSPSCIPHPACKFRRKYKALADCSASRINPDSPSGIPLWLPIVPPQCRIHFPAVQCSLSDRASSSWLSARWMSSLHRGHV